MLNAPFFCSQWKKAQEIIEVKIAGNPMTIEQALSSDPQHDAELENTSLDWPSTIPQENERAEQSSSQGQPFLGEDGEPTLPGAIAAEPTADLLSPIIKKLLESLPETAQPKEKTTLILEMMASILTAPVPSFRDFWSVQRYLAETLKACADDAHHPQWVEEMQRLCKEAKTLRTRVLKASRFAAEQIELALQSLEQELTDLEDLPLWHPSIEAEKIPQGFDLDFYAKRLSLLQFLSKMTLRITSLKHELLQSTMLPKSKTALLTRLRAIGALCYPSRRELLKEVGDHLFHEVEELHARLHKDPNLHFLSSKSTIRVWQQLTKELALTPVILGRVHRILSDLWVWVKEGEQRLREEKAASRQQAQAFHEKLRSLTAQLATGEKAKHQLSYLRQELKGLHLRREDHLEQLMALQQTEDQLAVSKSEHPTFPLLAKGRMHENVSTELQQHIERATLESWWELQAKVRKLYPQESRIPTAIVRQLAGKKEALLEEELSRLETLVLEKPDTLLSEPLVGLREQTKQALDQCKKRHALSGKGLADAWLQEKELNEYKKRLGRIDLLLEHVYKDT